MPLFIVKNMLYTDMLHIYIIAVGGTRFRIVYHTVCKFPAVERILSTHIE